MLCLLEFCIIDSLTSEMEKRCYWAGVEKKFCEKGQIVNILDLKGWLYNVSSNYTIALLKCECCYRQANVKMWMLPLTNKWLGSKNLYLQTHYLQVDFDLWTVVYWFLPENL